MTTHPLYILAVLIAIEAAILTLAARPIGKKLFKFLPSMFWIYFLPMLANTFGLLPVSHDLYGQITKWLLPAALALLLLSADIRGILRLGPVALGAMAFSVTGIVIGAPAVTFLYRQWLPEDAWKGIGALSASWIGGSANMIAVGKAIGTPDDIFAPIIIVDTIIPYCWMGLLIALSAWQSRFDRWNRSNTSLIEHLTRNASTQTASGKTRWSMIALSRIAAIAVIAAAASVLMSKELPVVENAITPAAWSIILATFIGIALSFTPARKLHSQGATAIGFALLYLVLASIGAKTGLTNMKAAPILLAAGATWIAIHAICLLIAARLLKAPMALLASASQASIGGPASAPVIAGVYHPELPPVGLLLAVLGNIAGTFLGLLAARLCNMVW